MSEVKGIKETKEALVGVLKLAAACAALLKDGAQASDALALFAKFQTDEVFKAALVAAAEGIHLVPEEAKDLSMAEGFELAQAAFPEVLEIVKALKK